MERLLNDKLENKINTLPKSPGVYIMFDKDQTVIYVGKARNLSNRVRQYFAKLSSKQAKVARMVSKIDDFEYVIVNSELEALILEANLIKQYKPFFNVLMRDDKQYPYIKIDIDQDYPRIQVVRKVENDRAKYFGPYQAAHIVTELMDAVYKIYPLRSCSKDIEKAQARHERPCINYQMGRCKAPCAGYITKEEYKKIVSDAVELLSGNFTELEKNLKSEMLKSSEAMNYELAAIYRDKLRLLDKISEKQKTGLPNLNDKDIFAAAVLDDQAMVQAFFVRSGKLSVTERYEMTQAETKGDALSGFLKQFYKTASSIPKQIFVSDDFEDREVLAEMLSQVKGSKVTVSVPQRGDNRKLSDLARKNAEEALIRSKNYRDKEYDRTKGAAIRLGNILGIPYPRRMECYDISNTQGTNTVASMVVFIDGKPDKKEYRRFRIKTVEGPNDFASMAEVLRRRLSEGYKASDSEHGFGAVPDLIVVDGGKGQLSSAVEILESMGMESIPVVGLAKRLEEIYKPYESEPVVLPFNTGELRLITHLRDEAHRFAITYHRALREKGMVESELDQIGGIGPKRKLILIDKFKDVDSIRNATLEELSDIKGIDIRTARNIFMHFHE